MTIPPVCAVLGFVLEDNAESNYHRTVMIHGSLGVMFQRPIALGILMATILSLSWPWTSPYLRKLRGQKNEAEYCHSETIRIPDKA